MIRNVIIGNCGFFPFHSWGALLTFLKRLSDVLECLANTSCQPRGVELGLNYLCKLTGCTMNVQPVNLHKIFFRHKARQRKEPWNIYVIQCDHNCLSETFKHKRMDVFWKLFHFHNITTGGTCLNKYWISYVYNDPFQGSKRP